MVYQATHTTRYRYQSPVSQSQSEANTAHLPRADAA